MDDVAEFNSASGQGFLKIPGLAEAAGHPGPTAFADTHSPGENGPRSIDAGERMAMALGAAQLDPAYELTGCSTRIAW